MKTLIIGLLAASTLAVALPASAQVVVKVGGHHHRHRVVWFDHHHHRHVSWR